MAPRKRALTIQDVAQAAGVSVSTVSRVLNQKDDVSEETQRHVLDVIQRLGYTSNLAARSMRSRRTNLIGLVMPDIEYPYAIEIMKGVNRAIAELDFDLLLYTTGDARKDATALHQQRYVTLLNSSLTDGVVVVAPSASEFFTQAPIVLVDPPSTNPDFPSILATNYEGALEATQYLISLGHQRIAFITGRPNLQSSEQRFQGYRDALAQAGIPFDPTLVAEGDYTTQTAIFCARYLLSLPEPPTAIFAANDQSAIGVLQVAKELGVRVPEDLSVIGFDNIPETAYFDLTTVDQFLAQMGYMAIQILVRIIRGEPLSTRIYQMPTRLVERKSCRKL